VACINGVGADGGAESKIGGTRRAFSGVVGDHRKNLLA
jgi:hypothetical protein